MRATVVTRPLSKVHVEKLAGQFSMSDLTLPFWGSRRKMPMHRIVRLEGEGNYTLFHFSDGSQLMVSMTLKKMESRLSSSVFVRPHKKNIINLLYLEGIHPRPAATKCKSHQWRPGRCIAPKSEPVHETGERVSTGVINAGTSCLKPVFSEKKRFLSIGNAFFLRKRQRQVFILMG